MAAAGNPQVTRLKVSVLKRIASSLRRLPKKMGERSEGEPGFFDRYPRFHATTTVGDKGEKLNERYRALIEPNKELIREKTILDIAAHDGRWSFAALEAGARHVTGIEVRSNLVEHGRDNCREYGISEDRYRFIVGDIFDQIDLVQPNSIDTVFCFGFFYHTPHHMLLLSKVERLNPKYLILDTEIDPSTTDCIVRFRKEKIAREANSLVGQPGDPSHAFVGQPSRSALETMLTSFGWTFSYYDWHRAGIKNWHGMRHYRDGLRVSLVATRG